MKAILFILMEKGELKKNILRLLAAIYRPGFYQITSHFGEVDFYILRQAADELIKEGLIQFDQQAWQNNQLALKITPQGRRWLQINDQNQNQYQQTTWLMRAGVAMGAAFLFALTFFLYQPFDSPQDLYRADLTTEQAKISLTEYFEEQEANIDNYEIILLQGTDQFRIYEINCLPKAECKIKSGKYKLEWQNEKWVLNPVQN